MIKIKNISKTFKDFTALKDINLEIEKGSLVILKGVSGSGKSTLLSIIASLQKPTSGEVIVDGKPISKLPDLHSSNMRLKQIGFVAQDFKLLDNLSVEENVSLALIALGFSPKEIKKRVKESIELSHITHKKDSSVKDLSGGEKQRVAIARSLATNPDILLCDEPTANLDKENSYKFLELLKELKALDKTIVIATHDPIFDDVSFIDKIVHIQNGVIVDGE